MSIKNLSIRTRLTALLAFVNVLLFAAAGYAWYAISSLNTRMNELIEAQNHVEEATDLSRRAQIEFKAQVQEWKNMLLRGSDPQLLERHSKGFAETTKNVRSLLARLNEVAPKIGLPSTLADKALAEHEELDKHYADAFRLYREGDATSAHEVDKEVRGIDRPANEHIDAIAKQVREHGDQIDQLAIKAVSSERSTLVAGLVMLVLLAAAVSLVVGVLTIAAISRRLSAAANVARTVAEGDLSTRIVAGRRDELGRVLQSMAEMNRSLAGIVGRVRDSAQKVSTAATQIAAGNTDLSSRTEEQASSLEETAASIEELTATVNQNANNAAQANQAAAVAADVARRGGAAVGDVVKTMDGIQESSRRIADITGLIDSIAFQTNILALNAAVEAARAGDQGRGFAVVAGEVRSLAQRSAEAAREIKSLIGESVQRVDQGAEMARGAGRTMDDIVTNVTKVSKLIGEIAAATTEQSSGIAQASTAVSELDKATQQNAALVEQSTAASEALRQLALEMAEAVSVFKLGNAQATLAEPERVDALAAPAQAPKLGAPEVSAAPALKRVPRSLASRAKHPAATTTVEEWKEF